MLSGMRPTKRKSGRQQPAACTSTPRFAHIVLAAVLGALTAKQAARLREAPHSDATQHCGEVRHQEQFGNKEQQVGLSARLQSGNLKNILDKVEDGVVVLTFADSKYKESMINWLINVERQGITNYAIVCLDHDLPSWLAERKGRCDYVMTGWKEGAWSNGGSNTCAGPDQKPTADASLGLCKMSCEQDVSCQAISWNKLHKLCYLCSAPKYEPSVMHQVYIKVCSSHAHRTSHLRTHTEDEGHPMVHALEVVDPASEQERPRSDGRLGCLVPSKPAAAPEGVRQGG